MNANFTPPAGEIDHNRRGLLSPEQAAFIANYRGWTLTYMMAPGVIGLAAGSALLAHPFDGHHDVVVIVLSIGAGLASLAGTALWCLYVWWRNRAPAHRNCTWLDGRVVWAGPPGPPGFGTPNCGWVAAGPDGVPLPLRQPVPTLPPGPYRFYLHDGYLVAAESPFDATRYYSITQNAGMFGTSPANWPPPLPVGDPGALVAGLAAMMGFTWEDLQYHRQGMLAPRRGVGRVFAVEGPLTFGWSGNPRYSVKYWWYVGGRQFPIPRDWIWLAPVGVVYRCYFDERSQRLLSMEPIPIRPVADLDDVPG